VPQLRDRKARMREAVVANVWHQIAELEKNPIVQEAVAAGSVQVVGAFYEIGSGAVDFLERPVQDSAS
jgi:carbonic anhydrase